MQSSLSQAQLLLPSDFDRWFVGQGAWMALPRRVITDILIERQAQEKVQLASKSEPARDSEGDLARAAVCASEHSTESELSKLPAGLDVIGKPPAWHAQWGAEAREGSHRVMLQFDSMYRGRFIEDRQLRSADADITKRLKDIVAKLVEQGPDRCYGSCVDARTRLEALEQEMPHFRAPLQLLTRSLALADATNKPVRITPMLLLGPPGVGKTHFSQTVAEIMGVPHDCISFDKPMAGSTLCGSDAHWSNSSYGMLFELVCLGQYTNPVILLDEIDKACINSSTESIRPLSQLHSALEPITARSMTDLSIGVQFDASLVTYIATANSLQGIETSILSRFEIFQIEPPEPREAIETARHIAASTLKRLGLQQQLRVDRKALYVLAHLSPRAMSRTVEKAAACAVVEQRELIRESDLWDEIGLNSDTRLH